MMSKRKRCSCCKKLLPLEKFSKQKKTKDGLNHWCKACTAEYKREWAKHNKEKINKSSARWRRENPETARIARVNSKAKAKSVRGTLHVSNWLNLLDSCNGICPCCGQRVELEIDHINPLSKGGPNLIENVQPICALCNNRKYTKTICYV